jgi:hypothetical protein
MKYVKFSALAIALMVAFAACRYDNTEELYVEQPCDTTNATYSAFVAPLVEQECLSCHGQSVYAVSGNGILLEGYANMIDYVTIGSFIGSIKHESAYEAMPDGGAKLSNCDIQKLDIWIANGAQDN